MILRILMTLLALFICNISFAGESTKLTVRVTGLFSKDREKDLREVLTGWPEVKLGGINFDRAEVDLHFDAGKLFPKLKPAEIIARLDERLRDLSNHTFGVRAVSTVPREKLKHIEIPVVGLDCKACCLAAYEIVAQIDGVEQATASFREGRITATIDPEKTDKSKLEAAIKQRGVTLR